MSDLKLLELVDRLKAAHAKTSEALDAVEAYVNQEPTDGQLARKTVEAFAVAWKAAYKADYVVGNWRAAIVGMKRLIVAHGVIETERRIKAYLASNDPFYRQTKHEINVFLTSANKFVAERADTFDDVLSAPPQDCRHRPPCRSDLQCTRRQGAHA